MPVLQFEITDEMHSEFKEMLAKKGLKIAFLLKELTRKWIENEKLSHKEA